MYYYSAETLLIMLRIKITKSVKVKVMPMTGGNWATTLRFLCNVMDLKPNGGEVGECYFNAA